MLNPNHLRRQAIAVASALKLTHTAKLKLKTEVNQICRSLQIKFNFKPNMAPVIHPKTIMAQAEQLWKETRPNNLKAVYQRKVASLLYIFTTVSMRRWIDLCRLRWDDIKIQHQPFGRYLVIRLAVSKTNDGNKREDVVMAEQPDNWACPLKLLAKFWWISGKPTNGFIFPCPNTFDNKKCPGHRNKPCLGHETGDNSYGFLQRFAKKKNWKNIPRKHTGRRTAIMLANQATVNVERIMEMAGWNRQSDMNRHYVASSQATSDQGVAALFATQLQNQNSFPDFEHLCL